MQLMKFVAFLTIYFREQRRTTIKHELIVKHKILSGTSGLSGLSEASGAFFALPSYLTLR